MSNYPDSTGEHDPKAPWNQPDAPEHPACDVCGEPDTDPATIVDVDLCQREGCTGIVRSP